MKVKNLLPVSMTLVIEQQPCIKFDGSHSTILFVDNLDRFIDLLQIHQYNLLSKQKGK